MPAAFPEIPKISYDGPHSKNPLAFRHYNAGEIVEGHDGKLRIAEEGSLGGASFVFDLPTAAA